jgi:DNA-binding winged helix-turn-helix (wHTH) protein/tetratricopeptide (TPR) repeat protein
VGASSEPARTVQRSTMRFGGFELDLQTGELTHNGTKNRLQGQPLHLLELLLRRPGQIVTRDEIRQHLWPDGTVVEFEHSVNAAVKRLREALHDDAEKPTFIETIPRRGYRFIAVVEAGKPAADVQDAFSRSSLERVAELWNTRRLAFAGVLAAGLVVAGLTAWRLGFMRPALSDTDTILLASFINKTGDPIFDNSLGKALEVKLSESPFLSIFPEADARATMRTMRLDPTASITRNLGIEICKRQGIKAVVVPEISRFGNNYLITLDAVDARTERSLAVRQAEAASKGQVIAALGEATSQLRRRLGESLASLEKYNAPLDLATTSSLEALQAYRAGLQQFRSGNQRESVAFLERAVELDPQFCSAYATLGTAYFSLGDDQLATKNFVKAFELKDGRVTQEENFQITALYHAYITGNLEKEIPVLLLYRQVYPRSVYAANRLGIAYAGVGRAEDALKQFQWALEHAPVPSAQYYSNTSQALINLGRFDDAKKLLDEWRQKGTLHPFQRQMRYRIAFFENDTATMDSLARQGPTDDFSWLQLQMQLAFLRGDFGKLRSASDTLMKQNIHDNEMENAANELALHAQLESFAGNFDSARKLCKRARDINKDTGSELWRYGEALGYAGDLAQAEAAAAKLDRIAREDTVQQKVYLQLIRSIVERERGNAVKAAELLTPAMKYEATLDLYYQRGRAYLAAGQYADAIADFDKLLGLRGWNWWQIYAPLAQLDKARCYAKLGDREKARKTYDDFFTTWKDADKDIPVLRQARIEYKGLDARGGAVVSSLESKAHAASK